jgi:hypothetical protein
MKSFWDLGDFVRKVCLHEFIVSLFRGNGHTNLNFLPLQPTPDIRYIVGAAQTVSYIGGKFKEVLVNFGQI